MWSEIWSAIEQAFELMGANDKMLNEILSTTMYMSLNSSLWAFLIGVPIGIIIANSNFFGKKVIVIIMRTCMGLPPVAVGIFLYLLFSGVGPFGKMELMFTVKLMIIAQIVLITPIVAGMTESSLAPINQRMKETTKGLNIGVFKTTFLTIKEGKYQLFAIYLFAFARSIAEVGAVQIVGGNILHKTRVMTTAIALNYNTGDLSFALALGIILIIIAFGANVIATLLQSNFKKNK